MRDRDIRYALRQYLWAEHPDPSDLLVDELPICAGRSRIDLALINGRIEGFEIKSQQDSLARLDQQQVLYSKVCDQVTLVAHARWVDRGLQAVPAWWGVMGAVASPKGITFFVAREPRSNPNPDPFSTAQLLWRDEALQVLSDRGLENGVRSKPRRVLWAALAERLEPGELRSAVRLMLRSRPSWRVDQQRK